MVKLQFLDFSTRQALTTPAGALVSEGVEMAIVTEVAGMDSYSAEAIAPPLLTDTVLENETEVSSSPLEATFFIDGIAGLSLLNSVFFDGRAVILATEGTEIALKVLTRSTSLFGKTSSVTVYFQKLGLWVKGTARDFVQKYFREGENVITIPSDLRGKSAFRLLLINDNHFSGALPWTISLTIETPLKNIISPIGIEGDGSSTEKLSYGLNLTQIVKQTLTYVITSQQAGSCNFLRRHAKIKSSAPFDGAFELKTSDGTSTVSIPFADCLKTISTEIDGSPLVTTPELFVSAGSVVTLNAPISGSNGFSYMKYTNDTIL